MEFHNIILEKKEGVAKIALNRPQVLNALNDALLQELAIALEDAAKDDEVGVVILTGVGRAFSAGRDMKEVGERAARSEVHGYLGDFPKPVIAAVNGYCYTGALELALCCDIIIASEDAVFADTHARYGLVHGWGGTQRLPRLVGAMRAKEFLLTSQPISAHEADRIGLVNKVVPREKLEEVAWDMAKRILANSQSSVTIIKSLVNRGLKMDLEAGLKMEAEEFRQRRQRGIAQESLERLGTFRETKKD